MVERVHMRRTAVAKEVDDSFCLAAEVRTTDAGIAAVVVRQDGIESQRTKAKAGTEQDIASTKRRVERWC